MTSLAIEIGDQNYQVDVPEAVLAYRAHIAERPAYQKAMAYNYPKLFGGAA